ncbi:MAG TPA: SH3-like domain-containing protein [Methylomirabilota bacterium]|nr:SH3-like domain-containing protein [Methylomirabilota bacterium]
MSGARSLSPQGSGPGGGEALAPRFPVGARVRVASRAVSGHVRTPGYVRGKVGWVAICHGVYRNPEHLAYGGDGLPKRSLYLVGFRQADLWPQYPGPAQDTVYLDVYDHWLEPA